MQPGDHMFRHESGRMVAALARIFGVHNLALAEDVVQDAFCRALEVWRIRGMPENPSAAGSRRRPRRSETMDSDCRRPFQANSDILSRRCRRARQPIRENPTRFATPLERTHGAPSAATPTQDFLHRLVDYRLTHTSLNRDSMPRGHGADAMGSHEHRGGAIEQQPGNEPDNIGRLDFI